jgi:hypothetical protein
MNISRIKRPDAFGFGQYRNTVANEKCPDGKPAFALRFLTAMLRRSDALVFLWATRI